MFIIFKIFFKNNAKKKISGSDVELVKAFLSHNKGWVESIVACSYIDLTNISLVSKEDEEFDYYYNLYLESIKNDNGTFDYYKFYPNTYTEEEIEEDDDFEESKSRNSWYNPCYIEALKQDYMWNSLLKGFTPITI